jgi:hypothetical protein
MYSAWPGADRLAQPARRAADLLWRRSPPRGDLQRHGAALALGGPRLAGAVTPLGGLLLIAGFAVFAWSALRG